LLILFENDTAYLSTTTPAICENLFIILAFSGYSMVNPSNNHEQVLRLLIVFYV